ncbi:MAG TPA: sugar-binding protein [bacterium]|nr:sugar-binding protein [bacterium]
MSRRLCLSIVLILLAVSSAHGADRRVIEAEEFDGLVRYPYHKEDARGWYARESTCRSYGAVGRGYHAQIHENAVDPVASKRLARPLPAGKYRVFLRVAGNNWQDRDNIVEVGLGEAAARFEWRGRGRFDWRPFREVELSRPVAEITLKAVQFGGKGFRHLYEGNLRTLAIDTIYITSDLSEAAGPSAEGTSLIELGREAPLEVLSGQAKTSRRTVLQAETPLPLDQPRVTPVKLAALDGRRNLWPNSSFELGGADGWGGVSDNYLSLHIFDERDHREGNAFHGRYSQRIPAGAHGTSRLVYLAEAGTYTLSLYIRGEANSTATVRLAATRTDRNGREQFVDEKNQPPAGLTIPVRLSGEWQRVNASGPLAAGGFVLRVQTSRECFVDAVQLEAGGEATPYQPRAAIEAGLATAELGNILYDDRPVLVAWATNSGNAAGTAVLAYDIVDVRDRRVAAGTVEIPVTAGATVRREVPLTPVRRGLFSCFYGLQGRPAPEGELVYAVLPKPPAAAPRHALACNMDNLPAALSLMKRMGHRWQLYCKTSRATSPASINPAPDRWVWDPAHEVDRLPTSLGLENMPCLWPAQLPKHLADAALSDTKSVGSGRRDVVRRSETGGLPMMPDLVKWRQYCAEVGRNLPEINWWTIDDETEMYFSPREFARIVDATCQGFADAGSKAGISQSCTPDYTEDMLAELGGQPPFQGFGASSYSFEYWDAVKVRGLQRRYGLPWSCIGVGWDNQPQMFHSLPGYTPVYASAARTARELVFLTLVQDARVIGHYTGRLWMRTGLFNTDFPLMDWNGVPLPHGFSYSCVGLLLANAVPQEDIYLEPLDTLLFVYRQDGRLGAATWANNTPNLDIHWKTWPRTVEGFTIPAEVDVLDMYGNPLEGAVVGNGKTVVTLTEEPFFFLNRNLSEADFLAALRSASAPPPPVEMRLAFLPDGRGGVDLGVWTANHTGRPLTGLKLDANFPGDRMVTKTDWMLPDRNGKLPDLPAGQAAFGRIPTAIGLDYPVENATFSVWLSDGQAEYPWYERCWLTVAPRVTATGGRVTDWSKVQPAWLYHTFSWGRFGRAFPQVVSGAENLKYAFRVDGRAAVRTGYDGRNLYVSIEVEDDNAVFTGAPEKRDRFELKFDRDLAGDFGSASARPDLNLLVLPESSGPCQVKGVEGAAAVLTRRSAGGYTVEVSVPLGAITLRPAAAGGAIGFDLVWTDADPETGGVASSAMRWAGGSRTLGQLFFGR